MGLSTRLAEQLSKAAEGMLVAGVKAGEGLHGVSGRAMRGIGKQVSKGLFNTYRAEIDLYKKAGSFLMSGGRGAGRMLARGPNGTTLPWIVGGEVNPVIQKRLIPAGLAAGVGLGTYSSMQAQASAPDSPGNIAVNGNLEISTPGMLDATGSMVFSMHKRGRG
jgi:hypothetical protein